jgi:hypothetical protein
MKIIINRPRLSNGRSDRIYTGTIYSIHAQSAGVPSSNLGDYNFSRGLHEFEYRSHFFYFGGMKRDPENLRWAGMRAAPRLRVNKPKKTGARSADNTSTH